LIGGKPWLPHDPGEPWLARHIGALDQLIRDAENDLPEPLERALGINQVSAFESLVGFRLRKIFEKYFKHHPSYTRDPVTDAVSGHFIDFTEAALKEMGITSRNGDPYSRSAIANALTAIRKTEKQSKESRS
jgi:hypothetical protein